MGLYPVVHWRLAFYPITRQPSLAWGDGIRLQREVVTVESVILVDMVELALNEAARVDFADDPLPFARLYVPPTMTFH